MKVVNLLLFFIVLSAEAWAQPGPPPPDPGPVPIQGIGFLIAAGAAFGIKKIIDHTRSNKP